MDLARSYFRNCSIEMADLASLPATATVPTEWVGNETTRPSWVANLNSDLKTWPRLLNAFPTAFDHCEICFRPAFQRGDSGTGTGVGSAGGSAAAAAAAAAGTAAAGTGGVRVPAQRHAIDDSAMLSTSTGVCGIVQ